MCGYGIDAWCQSDRDTAYELGKRAVGLEIAASLGEVDQSASACVKFYKEALTKHRERERVKKDNENEEENG